MTTKTDFKAGKCGKPKSIRVKIWKAGFSLKCSLASRTLVNMPFDQEQLERDFASFCYRCKQAEGLP